MAARYEFLTYLKNALYYKHFMIIYSFIVIFILHIKIILSYNEIVL